MLVAVVAEAVVEVVRGEPFVLVVDVEKVDVAVEDWARVAEVWPTCELVVVAAPPEPVVSAELLPDAEAKGVVDEPPGSAVAPLERVGEEVGRVWTAVAWATGAGAPDWSITMPARARTITTGTAPRAMGRTRSETRFNIPKESWRFPI